MFKIRFSAKIQKDLKLLAKRGYTMAKFEHVVKLLALGGDMPQQFRDHPLKGDWDGFRECHISPDWLLIYKVDNSMLILTLTRTGTHSDLFKK